MSSKLEQLYAVMPVSVQNLMVTAKGWVFARKRYGKKYRKHVDELMRSQWLRAEELRLLQVKELRQLIKEAADNTEYYHTLPAGLLANLEDVTLDNMSSIPLLEKNDLRTRTAEFINKNRLRHGYSAMHTSGTSGTPITMPYDFESSCFNEAFRERQYRWAGITGSDISVRLSGRLILGRHKGPPFWRYNAARRQWFFSTYHMTDENLSYHIDKLAKIQPVFMDGYPSAFVVLAKWIQSHDRAGEIKPRAILTTAETLMPNQRELIESVFGCKVFNYYSSSEGSPYITECAAGGYHINPESGIVEILKPNGEPANDGEIGELVVTSFFQRTVPLIRYRIGDVAISQNGPCSCGRQMPLVKSLTGRLDDQLWTQERGYVGRLGPVFKSIPPSIKEAQIVQTKLDEIELRYVPDEKLFTDEHLQKLLGELKKRLGKSVSVKPIKMTEILRGKNGKFRAVIREIDLPNMKEQGR